MPSLSPMNRFLTAAAAAHLDMGADMSALAERQALRFLANITPDTFTTIEAIGFVRSVFRSGSLSLVQALWSWLDTHEEALLERLIADRASTYNPNPNRHLSLALEPKWMGAPHALVGRLWLRVTQKNPQAGFAGLVQMLEDSGTADPGTESALMSLLLVPDVWACNPTSLQESVVRSIKARMNPNAPSLTPAVKAALDALHAAHASPDHFVAAYKHHRNYHSVLILRLFQPTSTLVHAFLLHGLTNTPTVGSIHKATAMAAALPSQEEMQALVRDHGVPHALDAIYAALRPDAKRRTAKAKKESINSPEAIAKRAARAAKKAAVQI